MALSKNFFGLRQGSTRSLTFQVDHGVQVTKERVTDVSNPQTRAQMEQRMKAVMVANARARLKGIINHSFEGVRYGEDSLREFSRLNMRKNALHVNSWVKKGINDCGVADFIVSNGSLPPIEVQFSFNGWGGIASDYTLYMIFGPDQSEIEDIKSTENEAEKLNKIVDAILQRNEYLQEGDVLHFLFCKYIDNSIFLFYAPENPRFKFVHVEFSLLHGANKSWHVTEINEHLIFYNGEVLFSTPLIGDGRSILICYLSSYNLAGNLDPIYGICSAGVYNQRTQNGITLCSPTRMNIAYDNFNVDKTKGYTFDEALATYLKPGRTSPKYLNSGIDGVDITGGK